ncbi:MAG: aldo/keto reductase [Defluviitaleaceae bacterium]|nr:aldo/keto reductase [Defluviitaleaceae bacterium]
MKNKLHESICAEGMSKRMPYRDDKISGNKLSALGFGCMRFPSDIKETERMILAAIDGGVNFFDTAYIYPKSEITLGEILAKHKKRKKVYIATKLPLSLCKSYEDFDRFFEQQLARLKTNYIDYYFMHSIINYAQWEKMLELGIEKWLDKKKNAGQIRHVGFSFHGSRDEFLKVLNSREWEFCMIQYNYYDQNYQAGKTGLLAAAEKGIPVFAMEPLLGGRLATGLPQKAVRLFADANPERTPAEWALNWLWNHPEITVVLSGMSSLKITEANLSAARAFEPLSENELAVYDDIISLFKKSFRIPCTACNYCLPCPKGIDIPARFSAYNASYTQNWFTGIMMYMTGIGALSENPISAKLCNACGHCERNCPQNLPIRKSLKKVTGRLEPLPIRLIMKLARKFIK